MSDIPQGGVPGANEVKRPSYRVVLFDNDGKVRSSTPLTVTDDERAKAIARRMANGLNAELWDGLRYVERYDCEPAAP